MTFQSLFLEEHATWESAASPYVSGQDYNIVVRLDSYAWPSNALKFAYEHGHPVDYVDSAWSRVAMDSDTTKRFLEMGAAANQATLEQIARIKDDHWYVMNDEEF